MEKFIIHSTQYINNEIVHTPIGYTTDLALSEDINLIYDNTLISWVETNKVDLENGAKSISEFFIDIPIVYNAKTGVNYEVDYPEITDINQL